MITLYAMLNDGALAPYINEPIKYLSQDELKTYGLNCSIGEPVVHFKVVDDQQQFIFYKFIALKHCIHLDDQSILLSCHRTGKQLKLNNTNTYQVRLICMGNPKLNKKCFAKQLDKAKVEFYKNPVHLKQIDDLIDHKVIEKTGETMMMSWTDRDGSDFHHADNYSHGINGCDNDAKLLNTLIPPTPILTYLRRRERCGK